LPELMVPLSAVFDGKINMNGEALILVDGRARASAAALGHPPDGTKFSNTIAVKFEGSRGTGTRLSCRICDFVFAKQ
jgi:hypothetical protein